MTANILVVDDAAEVTQTIAKLLTRDGVAVVGVQNLSQAREQLSKSTVDLIVLDIGLEGEDGFAFFSELQKAPQTAGIPVIFLTGSIEAQDQVTAFSMGAEDFVSKVDFNPENFKARVEARLKKITQFKEDRAKKKSEPANDRFVVDLVACKAFALEGKEKRELALSPVEVKILAVLMSHEGQILNRAQLIDLAGLNAEFDQHHGDSHFVDGEVGSLKRKLGASLSMHVQTILGLGYRYIKNT